MECPRHKGREMIELTTDPAKCPTCGYDAPPTLTGWKCHESGQEYDVDGKEKGKGIEVADVAASDVEPAPVFGGVLATPEHPEAVPDDAALGLDVAELERDRLESGESAEAQASHLDEESKPKGKGKSNR